MALRFRLHIVDLPGYGASPAFEADALEHLAREVTAALPEKVHVCGWSLGGQVALEMARLFPDRIERLVLTASTPCFTAREGWPCAVRREVLLEFAAALETDYEGTLKRFLALQARGDAEVKTVLKRLREILFTRGRPDVQTLRAGLNILLESDLRGRVAADENADLAAPRRTRPAHAGGGCALASRTHAGSAPGSAAGCGARAFFVPPRGIYRNCDRIFT